MVVVQEIFGLEANIRALSDRLAAMGYLAVAPDFYGGRHWTRCLRGAFAQLSEQRGPFFTAIDGARERLAGRPECNGRVGVIGFCLRGGFALIAAAQHDFQVAAVNYGEVPDDPASLLRCACPVVASYGGRDRSMRGRAERLENGLQEAEVPHDVKSYPEAGHSFLSTTRYPAVTRPLAALAGMSAGPNPAAASDAWQRIDTLFVERPKR